MAKRPRTSKLQHTKPPVTGQPRYNPPPTLSNALRDMYRVWMTEQATKDEERK